MVQTDLIGKNILGYTVSEKLGSGAFGTVYKVIKTNAAGQYVRALKHITIPTEKQYNSVLNSMGGNVSKADSYFSQMLNNIVSEIRILNDLSEKGVQHIVRYYENDILVTDSPRRYDIFILMEYLTPLEDFILDNEFTVRDVVKLGLDVLSGLRVCHNNGIIHRDIKDDNIFVSTEGKYKIGDFGISKVLKDSSKAESIKGTPNFLAPEVYLGKEGYTKSVDLYSLGIVLYRLLNYSRNPFLPRFPEQFYAKDEDSAFEERMKGKIPDLPSLGGENIGRVVVKAISGKDERFKTVDEFFDALKNALNNTADETLLEKIRFDVFLHTSVEPKEYEETIGETVSLTDFETTMDEECNAIHKHLFDTVGDAPVDKLVANSGEDAQPETDFDNTHTGVSKIVKIAVLTLVAIVLIIAVIAAKGNYKLPSSDPLDKTTVAATTDCSIVAESTTISVGETTDLAFKTGEYLYRNDPSLTWNSNDAAVATVDSNGVVTGISAGTVRITGTLNNFEAIIDITVEETAVQDNTENNNSETLAFSDVSVDSLEICCYTTTLLIGDSISPGIKADNWFLNGNSTAIEWNTDDTSVAIIDKQGVLTARSTGTCNLIASYGGKTVSQKITVVDVDKNSGATVIADYEKLSLSSNGKDTVNLIFGGNISEHFGATSYYSAGMSLKLEWGELNDNSVSLTIEDVHSNSKEGYVTILVYDQENPGKIIATTKIYVRIN